ncbi:hypothetical protein SOVF_203850 [Spinacia oleracea]|nr:hypothetical protein SOVF_203850 [Spinacia oleracea]
MWNKDTMKARLDLIKMNVRDELHPILDGDKVHVPVACYTLSSTAKAAICDMFSKLKSPDGYLSNISRCVKDNGKKISCYLADECLTFCSRYMSDIDTKFNRKGRNDDEEGEDHGFSDSNLEIFRPLGRPIGQGAPVHLSFEECDQIHSYILNNCDELVQFAKEHKLELEKECPRNIEKRHKALFPKWVLEHVREQHEKGCVDDDLYNLVCGPSRVARRYAGYIVNGFRFHTNDRSENRKTQNCGIMVRGDDSSDKEYYGVLGDIFEIHYPGRNSAYVFKCNWYDVGHHGRGYKVDEYGITNDPREKDWQFVIKAQPRDLYDMPDGADKELADVDVVDVDMDAYQQIEVEDEHNINSNLDDLSVDSLATDKFVVERESKVVEMVKKWIEEHKTDLDFIDDGEIEEFEDSCEEEEEFDSET